MMAVGVPILAVLLGVLISNSRLTDLRLYIANRSGSMEAYLKEAWRAELRRFEEVLDARLKHLEDNP